MAEENRPKIGLGVVIVREGLVLIGKRKGTHGADTWSIPGGHLEFGESWEACARREAEEETGLHIENVHFLGVTDDHDIGEGKHYTTIFMKSESLQDEPMITEPDKYIELRWSRWEEIPSPRFKPLETLMRQGVHPLGHYYGKLVRDRIPEIIEEHGDRAIWHTLDLNEYREALKAKLAEEVLEYIENDETEELADILEVLQSLQALSGTHREQLQLLQNKKRTERGGFEQRIILDETR